MRKINSIQKWIPIEKILEKGIIKLKKNKYIKILKVNPINFNLKTQMEKESILNSYKIFLKTCNFDIQILIQSKKEDLTNHIEKIKIKESTSAVYEHLEKQDTSLVDKSLLLKNKYNQLISSYRQYIDKEKINELNISKYIPQEIVAHKIGSNESYIHDVGIIFSDSPYILVIYTNGLAYPDEKIAQISKAIYNNYN